MQLQELTSILQYPETLKTEKIGELKTLVDRYSYFQPVRALYLKALKNKDSYKYNNALKVTAAHTTDRSVLFDFITSEVFNQNEISQQIKQNSEYIKNIEVNAIDDISINRSVTIDDALKRQVEATDGVLDPNLFEEKEVERQNIPSFKISGNITNLDPIEEKLQIGKPLEFSSSETHSFSEWLKITSFKPIDRSQNQIENEAPISNKLEAIDKFITENPKIKPTANTPKPKLVNNEESTDDSLMTETLARIYLEQKNYEKAIQSYRILSLKYPEKSSFFADQIKAIKELREHNNTNND
ncbi:hypothetical protein BTO05_11935 [Winogradskyella sp. PC-19]|uniref:hypothetical protein n=1 Tax=unclassified Winogradskyella TaxID=2615021 RepID=UPI000B3D4C32|nr:MULTISPECIES: hypothetical protein [unclassified Winogradskyella]ARV10315.1 hypothetical protein BTO05_11935 [Winogradskyella sp. PC-19]